MKMDQNEHFLLFKNMRVKIDNFRSIETKMNQD